MSWSLNQISWLATLSGSGLGPGYPQLVHGPASSSSILWGLVWNSESQPHPGMTKWDLPFIKTPGWLISTFQVEKFCARIPEIEPPCPIGPGDRPAIHCESPGQFFSKKSGPNSGNSGGHYQNLTHFLLCDVTTFSIKREMLFSIERNVFGEKSPNETKERESTHYITPLTTNK